jgi:hypothetical protein
MFIQIIAEDFLELGKNTYHLNQKCILSKKYKYRINLCHSEKHTQRKKETLKSSKLISSISVNKVF